MAKSVSGFNQAIHALHAQYESQKAKNSEISRKIEELQRARSYMVQARSRSEELRGIVRSVKIEERWVGSLAEEVRLSQKANSSRAELIVNGINKGIGEIDSHIWKLRTEYDYIAGMMSKIEDSIEVKTRERNRFIAEEKARRAQRV